MRNKEKERFVVDSGDCGTEIEVHVPNAKFLIIFDVFIFIFFDKKLIFFTLKLHWGHGLRFLFRNLQNQPQTFLSPCCAWNSLLILNFGVNVLKGVQFSISEVVFFFSQGFCEDLYINSNSEDIVNG